MLTNVGKLKDSYDVIVVGCGPAGSSTAQRCAEHGLEVLALDRNLEIGTPVRCGEGLSARTVRELGLDMPKAAIAQEIDGAWVYAPNRKKIEIRFERSKGYILERKAFDKWLAMRAGRAGAYVIAKTTVHDIIQEKGFVTGVKASVIGEELDIRAKVVVACDGAESIIMRRAGIRSFKNPRFTDSGFEYEMVNVDMEDSRMIELWFGNALAPRGYLWSFPKGKDISNVGVGVGAIHGSGKTAQDYLDAFIAEHPNFSKGAIVEVKGGAIPVGGFLQNMVGNGLLGVGDAVSQVNPIHGGGMGEAIRAGNIAGEVIAKAIVNKDWSANGLAPYNTIWWEQRGNMLKKVEKVRELFENMTDAEMNILVDVLSGKDLMDLSHGDSYAKVAKIYAEYKVKAISHKIVSRLKGHDQGLTAQKAQEQAVKEGTVTEEAVK